MSIVLKMSCAKDRPPLRGIEHYWKVMMDAAVAGRSFTAKDIFDNSNTRMSDILDFVRRLLKARFIEETGAVCPKEKPFYRVLIMQSTTPKVRRDGTVIEGPLKQQAIWMYMRSDAGRNGFSAQDISVWVRAGEAAISVSVAKSYIELLYRAGYLLELEKGKPGKPGVYCLHHHMNTGPKAPMIIRAENIVFDQNRHEPVGMVKAAEVLS